MPLMAILGATALTSPLAVSPALAQDQSPSTDDNVIIVTAQRRAEALENVPMTVVVLSQGALADNGINSVRDLSNMTSGFQIGNSGSSPNPAIRGVTANVAGSYENNVAVFVDGLYQPTPQVLNIDLPNVQNIQILKGPQGTLYGRNATGGAILIETIDPSDAWQGNAELTYGRFDDKRARGYVSGPISDTSGVSLAGTYRQTDGYYKIASRSTPGQFDGRGLGLKQGSLRAKFKVDLTDSFHATLGYNYAVANDPRGVFFTPIENVLFPYTGGNATRPKEVGAVAGDFFKVDFTQHEGFLKLEYDTPVGLLRSITGYTHAKARSLYDFYGSYEVNNQQGIFGDGEVVDRSWQESVDLTVDAIKDLVLVVGGNYYNIKTDLGEHGRPNTSASYLGPAVDTTRTIVPYSSYTTTREIYFRRTKQAWAIFADATYQATDRLSLNVGGRFSKETQDVAAEQYGLGGKAGGGTMVYSFAASARGSSYKKFTPRATIRYEISPRNNVYASYSKGFRGGEWNSVPPSATNLGTWVDAKQETVDAFEVGFKHGGGRLRLDMAGFYYDYKNLLVSSTSQIGGLAVVTVQNAPKAEIYGAEASFSFEIAENLNVRGGATWLHARYGDGFIFDGTGVNPRVNGFNANSDPLKVFANKTVTQDLSGLQMARAPNFSGYFGFDYTIPNRDGGLKFAANLKYSDGYAVTSPSVWGGWVSNPADPLYKAALVGDNRQILSGTADEGRASKQRARQGKFALLNASVTWTDPTDTYYVRVWGNNLTDTTYLNHYGLLSVGSFQLMAEPLTFGATMGIKFGGQR